MSTLQISAPLATAKPLPAQRPMLRLLGAVVDAMAETNRRRAEREIARVARTYGLGTADRA
jgi:hypothetical protein